MRFLLIIFLCIPGGFAATRTVGSGQTHATIQAAINACSAGDVVSIHEAKTYSETLTLPISGTAGNLVTVQNDSGGTVLVSSTSTPLSVGRSYWKFFGIRFEYAGSGSNAEAVYNDIGTAVSNLTFDGCYFIKSGGADGYCAYLGNVDALTVINCHFNTSGGSGGADALDALRCSNLILSNNVVDPDVRARLDDGFVISGTNLVVAYNTIRGGEAASPSHPDAIVIQGDGTKFNITQDVYIHHNRIEDFSQCIYLDAIESDLKNVQVYDNLLLSVAYGGSGSVNGIINDGENIGGSATYKCNLLALNNTIDVRGTVFRATRQISTSANNTKTFENNLVINPSFTAIYCDTTNNVVLDYNLYDSAGDATITLYDGAGKSLAQLQAYGQEAHGLRTATGANSDYTLTNGSAAKNAGVDLSAYFADDFAGNNRPSGSGWEIGAFEYVELGGGAPSSSATIQISGGIRISGGVRFQ